MPIQWSASFFNYDPCSKVKPHLNKQCINVNVCVWTLYSYMAEYRHLPLNQSRHFMQRITNYKKKYFLFILQNKITNLIHPRKRNEQQSLKSVTHHSRHSRRMWCIVLPFNQGKMGFCGHRWCCRWCLKSSQPISDYSTMRSAMIMVKIYKTTFFSVCIFRCNRVIH